MTIRELLEALKQVEEEDLDLPVILVGNDDYFSSELEREQITIGTVPDFYTGEYDESGMIHEKRSRKGLLFGN